jgi:hypothetical protein
MHSEQRRFRWTGIPLVLVAGACGAAPDEQSRQTGEPGEREWFEDCEGTFACTAYIDGYDPASNIGQLARRGAECLWLDDEGTPRISLSDPAVSIHENYFVVSLEIDTVKGYVECLPVDATAKKDGCAGSAKSCSAVGLLDCDSQDGCHSQIGDAYTSSDDRCSGSADRCDTFDSKAACEHQRGCRWEG